MPLASLFLFSIVIFYSAARLLAFWFRNDLWWKILIDRTELSHQSTTHHMGLNSGHAKLLFYVFALS